ncbi:MAG: biotin/lipoate A/B protein ligase family protein [Acidimicrobiia bacterium]
MASQLRIIDFGEVSGLRSQTLWHALAYGVSEDSPPTLSFMQPTEPYVSIGYHRSPDELDPEVCGARGFPVYRRMVGGGPVYIDRGQLFFQVIVPAESVEARRADAIRRLLEPAVAAFNDVGICATLDGSNEVVVGDRKICGHAAGQIGKAVVVVGNVIDSFDHTAAASIVKAPSCEARNEFLAQMRRFVVPTPTDFAAFAVAARDRYSEALDLPAVEGDLTSEEGAHLARLDQLFTDPEWIHGVDRPPQRWWRAKVKSGVWVAQGGWNGTRLTVAIEGDRVRSLRVGSDRGEPLWALNGHAVLQIEDALRILQQRDSGLAALLEEIASRPPA